jgi:hypothetical protein
LTIHSSETPISGVIAAFSTTLGGSAPPTPTIPGLVVSGSTAEMAARVAGDATYPPMLACT